MRPTCRRIVLRELLWLLEIHTSRPSETTTWWVSQSKQWSLLTLVHYLNTWLKKTYHCYRILPQWFLISMTSKYLTSKTGLLSNYCNQFGAWGVWKQWKVVTQIFRVLYYAWKVVSVYVHQFVTGVLNSSYMVVAVSRGSRVFSHWASRTTTAPSRSRQLSENGRRTSLSVWETKGCSTSKPGPKSHSR